MLLIHKSLNIVGKNKVSSLIVSFHPLLPELVEVNCTGASFKVNKVMNSRKLKTSSSFFTEVPVRRLKQKPFSHDKLPK